MYLLLATGRALGLSTNVRDITITGAVFAFLLLAWSPCPQWC
jgi:hypothetical protein